MKLANGLSNETASGHASSPLLLPGHRREKLFGLVSGAAGVSLLFLLLPEALEPLMLDVIGWSLVTGLAIAALVLGVRILDGVLDL